MENHLRKDPTNYRKGPKRDRKGPKPKRDRNRIETDRYFHLAYFDVSCFGKIYSKLFWKKNRVQGTFFCPKSKKI